jgi:hypothetical protein
VKGSPIIEPSVSIWAPSVPEVMSQILLRRS